MGVARRGLTVGGPTGMGNTDGTADILVTAKLYEVIDFSFGLIDVQTVIVVDECHTGAIVTTILQSSKPFDQDGKSILCAYVPYDSAHILFGLCQIRVQNYTFSSFHANFITIIFIINAHCFRQTIQEGCQTEGHMPHRPTEVDLHTGLQQEPLLIIPCHHHHIHPERSLVFAFKQGSRPSAYLFLNGIEQINWDIAAYHLLFLVFTGEDITRIGTA